jgi:serpin B
MENQMKHHVTSLLLCTITLLELGCDIIGSKGGAPQTKTTPPETMLTVDVTSLLAREIEIIKRSPKSSNILAFDLYKELSAKEKNLTFSPFSVSLALAMTYAGAKDETEQSMKNTLYFGENTRNFHKSYGEFANLLAHKDRTGKETVLKISNALWLQKNFHVLDDFKGTLADAYGANPVVLDFKNEPGPSTKLINQTVSAQTNGEIDKLLKQDLKENTRLVLTNAIYFKSKWQSQFLDDDTEKDDFFKADGSTMKAKFMKQIDHFFYSEDDKKQYLMMHYKDYEFAALFVLPREGKFKAVEEELNDDSFNNMFNGLITRKKVNVWLPKFSQRTSPNMKEVLIDLGLGVLFDRHKANLRKINDDIDVKKNLYVGDILHEAVVKMYEAGTTAAAATAVVNVEEVSMPPVEPEKIVKFHAKRPFLFLIVHIPSKTILFMGRVDEPETDDL